MLFDALDEYLNEKGIDYEVHDEIYKMTFSVTDKTDKDLQEEVTITCEVYNKSLYTQDSNDEQEFEVTFIREKGSPVLFGSFTSTLIADKMFMFVTGYTKVEGLELKDKETGVSIEEALESVLKRYE